MDGQCAVTFSSRLAPLGAQRHLRGCPGDVWYCPSCELSLLSQLSRVNQTGLDPVGSNYRKFLQVPYPRQTAGLGMWGQVQGEGL